MNTILKNKEGDILNSTFSILHLSDLHIAKTASGDYSWDLHTLISDIVDQINKMHVTKLMIVVSGDIIDKGESEYYNIAVNFFDDLNDAIRQNFSCLEVVDIQIVPGNHDRKRMREICLFSMAHQQIDMENEYDWNLYQKNSIEFIEMVNTIYNIFGKSQEITKTFGCELASIGDNNICFIRTDSAWCAVSNSDKRKIRFGSYQLKKLNAEYQAFKAKLERDGKKIDITIAISHHPTTWMQPDDESLFKSYIMKEKYMNVDMMLSGHIHSQSVENLYNHEHSILSLVTGIGWGEKRPDEINEHRYSIYSLNIPRNCCEICVRKTKANDKYDFDYSIYTDEEGKNTKIFYPIKIFNSYPFVVTNSMNDNDVSGIYVDAKLMSLIPHIVKSSTYFKSRVMRLLEAYQADFLCTWEIEYGNNEDVSSLKQDLIEHFDNVKSNKSGCKSTHRLKELMRIPEGNSNFCAFLGELCYTVIEAFQDCFSKGVCVRTHFRWYNSNKDELYSKLCSHYSDGTKDEPMQDLPWASLVQVAYNKRSSIVYSTNSWHSPISTKWKDYITIVPEFKGFELEEKYDFKSKKKRPAISFGLSLGGNCSANDSIILHLLSYLRVEELISEAIDEYVYLFNTDIEMFIEYLKTIKGE